MAVHLFLKMENNILRGATETGACLSNMRGASSAILAVTIQSDVLESLEHGFDYFSKQVRGSEYGPYIFKKIIK